MELPASSQESECPVCMGKMQLEEREDATWLVCPNGCPTETPAPPLAPEEAAKSVTAAA